MQCVQNAAKQKYARENRGRCKACCIGQERSISLEKLVMIATAVAGELREDLLPGLDSAAMTAQIESQIAAALATRLLTQTHGGATDETGLRNVHFKAIMAQKIKVQLAANAIWPPRHPKTAGTRREFALQPRREPVRM